MCQLGRLYIYELKKIVNRKIVWIVGCVMVVLCAFLSFSDLVSTSGYYGDTEVTGYESVKINREYAENFAGREIDDKLLSEMQDSYKSDSEETGSKEDNIVVGDQIAVVVGGSEEDEEETLISEYTPIYSYVQGITEDSDSTLEVDAATLYAKWESSILQNRADQMVTEKEQKYLEMRDAQIQTPFVYQYTDGWANLWEYAYTINYMVLLTLAVCLSGVFSMEHQRKTDAIILCSRYGKKQLYLAKILAGGTFGAVTAFILFGVTAVTSIFVYGADGFSAALQLAFPLSSRNLTVGESVLLLFCLLMIVSVLYSIGIMVLSELVKNSVAVMAVPVGFMILTMMVDIPYQFRVASQIYDLLPTNLLAAWELWDDRLVSVFGTYLFNFQIASMIYVVVIVAVFLLGKQIYQRYQIGGR